MIDFMSNYTMTIDGKAVATSETLDVINPATAKPFATCPRATKTELNAAVDAAAKAFVGWRATPIEDRRAAMRKAGDLIMANADAIASLFTKEQGRPAHLAKDEILGAGYWFHSTAELDLPVDVTEDTADRRVEVHHVPLGVICGIVPWNFPVLLAAWKIAPALLTGNTIVLKPSPFTPLCTLKIVELLRGVFPDGVLNVITGGDELGPWMTSHKGFAKITFTGSTATGKRRGRCLRVLSATPRRSAWQRSGSMSTTTFMMMCATVSLPWRSQPRWAMVASRGSSSGRSRTRRSSSA